MYNSKTNTTRLSPVTGRRPLLGLAWLITGYILLSWSTLLAQDQPSSADTLYLSLSDAIELGVEQNRQLNMARADVDIAGSRYDQSMAVFLPSLTLEENAVFTNDPITAFSFKLKQESITAADFNPTTLNDPDDAENYTTKLSVKQPVFNMDGFSERSAASYMKKSSESKLRATESEIRYRIQQSYYQYMLSGGKIDVLKQSKRVIDEILDQSQDYFDQGMITKADLLGARVQSLNTAQMLEEAKNQAATAEDQLRFLLGIREQTPIAPSTKLLQEQINATFSELTMPENSMLQAVEYQVSAAREMKDAATYSFVPRINLFGSYEYNDSELFGFNANSYTFGASLQWNLFGGFEQIGKIQESKANLRKAEIAYDQQREQVAMNVRRAKRTIYQAQTQLEMARAAAEQAMEDVRIRTDRYEEGLESTSDLLRAEASLREARLNKLMSIFKYNMAVATLEMLYETDLTN